MPLPLHIFEDRYKLMMQECVDQAKPFGVVLIKRGKEVGQIADPHPVGTSAIITQVNRLEENRMNIVSVGYQRFRIQELLYDRPYLRAVVKTLPPLEEETGEAFAQASLLRPRLKDYIEVIASLTDAELELTQVPEKPVLLAFMTAILLQVPLSDKQRLLVAETIPQMLALENQLLLRERCLLKANIGMEFTLVEGESGFSAN
jgi:Lon protease-like protein